MSSNQTSAPTDDPVLREALKRCSPATYYAACKFRAGGDLADLRQVILGVIERFVERDLRPKLHGDVGAVDGLRITQDLSLDSLTMMEIVMVAEEVLPITISNEELTRLATVGDVQHFIARKLQERPEAPGGRRNETAPEWNIATVGDEVRRIDATPAAAALTRFPEQRPNHA